MTEPGRPIAEEDLHGYVDGLLDDEGRAAVERYLQGHPEARDRIGAYAVQRSALRAAFMSRPADPVPPQLNLSRLLLDRLRRRRAPWPAAAAAAVLAAVLGGAGGWFLGSRPPTGIAALRQEAAANYSVFAIDTRRPVELASAQKADLARWLSRRLNRAITPPELSGAQYRLLGGRLVASPHGPAALFLYQNPSRQRLAIYVRPMPNATATPLEPIDVGDMDGCAWIDRGTGYVLIAPGSYEAVLRLARLVRQETRSRS